MKAQLYRVKIDEHDEAFGNIAASPVYLNDMSEDIIGVVVEDDLIGKTRIICLFQPTTNPQILQNILGIIADELPFEELEPLIDMAVNNATENMRGIKRSFWEQILDELKSQKESMSAKSSLADVLTKRLH